MEIPRLLLPRDLPTYHPSLTSGSLINDIWSSFFYHVITVDDSEMSFDYFAQCRDLTSVAFGHGALIDKCIDRNLLTGLESVRELQPDQILQLLQYFQRFGVEVEYRDKEGNTPLLAIIASDDDPRYWRRISIYLKANANLGAIDNMGRGYLRIVLERVGFLFGRSRFSNLDYQADLLAVLLSADPRFKERAIKPNETPRLIELAFSAVAWDVWTSVFQVLDWDMTEMNRYRYRVLNQPLPSYLEHYEEARLQMLAQTKFRLNLSL